MPRLYRLTLRPLTDMVYPPYHSFRRRRDVILFQQNQSIGRRIYFNNTSLPLASKPPAVRW
jgi:hypothetical protein